MYLTLPETTSSRQNLAWVLRTVMTYRSSSSSSSATQKSGRGSSSRFAQRPPTQQHVSRFPAAGTALCLLLHDTPNHLGAEAGSPDSPSFVDRTEEYAGRNPRGIRPSVNSSFYPIRDGNRSNVPTLADKIGNDPVLLPLLDVLNSQRSQFCSA
jgi:hypothetical protein